MKYILTLFLFMLVFLPAVSFATSHNVASFETSAGLDSAAGGLVPNCGADCNVCDLMKLVNTVVNYVITLLSVIAVIVMVIAGFRLVTSGGDTGEMEKAKGMFTNVVIGIIIVLAAWLIVDTVLRMLTNTGGLEAWQSDIKCNATAYQATTGAGTVSDPVVRTTSSGDETQNRAQLTNSGYTINKSSCNGQRYQDVSGGCTSVGGFSDGMMSSLTTLSQDCSGCSLAITGGSEAGHQTHSDGNSVDFRFDRGLSDYINNGGAASAGLRCVAESDHWHCRKS